MAQQLGLSLSELYTLARIFSIIRGVDWFFTHPERDERSGAIYCATTYWEDTSKSPNNRSLAAVVKTAAITLELKIMLTIPKEQVANWLLLEYMATAHTVNEKIRLFEQKYAQPWETFAQSIQTASEEDFEQWDDYIEWQAYTKMAQNLAAKMDEVRHGYFELA